jgi:hypothetical protein
MTSTVEAIILVAQKSRQVRGPDQVTRASSWMVGGGQRILESDRRRDREITMSLRLASEALWKALLTGSTVIVAQIVLVLLSHGRHNPHELARVGERADDYVLDRHLGKTIGRNVARPLSTKEIPSQVGRGARSLASC